MVLLKLVVATICLSIFAALAIGNAYSIIAGVWYKKHISAVPIIGGTAGTVGLLLLPFPWTNAWWWAPIIIDYGCLPIFIVFFIARIGKPRGPG